MQWGYDAILLYDTYTSLLQSKQITKRFDIVTINGADTAVIKDTLHGRF